MDTASRSIDEQWQQLLREPLPISVEGCTGLVASLYSKIYQVDAWKLLITSGFPQKRAHGIERLESFLKNTFIDGQNDSLKQEVARKTPIVQLVLLGLLIPPKTFYRKDRAVIQHLCRDISCFVDDESADRLLLDDDIRAACRGLADTLDSEAWNKFLEGCVPNWLPDRRFANASSIQLSLQRTHSQCWTQKEA